jgi:hypothetical protein
VLAGSASLRGERLVTDEMLSWLAPLRFKALAGTVKVPTAVLRLGGVCPYRDGLGL